MKNTVLLILVTCLFTPKLGTAQAKKKLFYSKHWELTHQDSAFYYRICSIDTVHYKFTGEVNDYLVSNELIMRGHYNKGVKNGLFTFYYPNGQIESVGYFKDNFRIGQWKYYYPNGKIWIDVTFSENDFQVNSLFDKSEKLLIADGTGEWYYQYEWNKLPFTIIVVGQFVNGKKEGEWKCLTSSGEKIYNETFSKNKFKKGIRFDSGKEIEYEQEYQNKFLPPYKLEMTEKLIYLDYVKRTDYPFLSFLPGNMETNATELTFVVVEESATPPGGMASFYEEYIKQNLTYPMEARRMGVEGRVYVEFIINRDGSITDVKVIKGIGAGCDAEAVRIISNSPNWNPGKQRGKPVRMRYVMPVIFKLDGSSKRK